jgi:YD repeat-containing protein
MYNQILDYFITYEYADNDRLQMIKQYAPDSVVTSYSQKIYHGLDSLPDEQLFFDSNGQLMQKQRFTYDGWGNLVGQATEGRSSCRLIYRK